MTARRFVIIELQGDAVTTADAVALFDDTMEDGSTVAGYAYPVAELDPDQAAALVSQLTAPAYPFEVVTDTDDDGTVSGLSCPSCASTDLGAVYVREVVYPVLSVDVDGLGSVVNLNSDDDTATASDGEDTAGWVCRTCTTKLNPPALPASTTLEWI